MSPGEGEEYELRSTALSMYSLKQPRDRKIIDWRMDCLKAMGFTLEGAATLALRRDVDLHKVQRMLDAGAQHDVVKQIVA